MREKVNKVLEWVLYVMFLTFFVACLLAMVEGFANGEDKKPADPPKQIHISMELENKILKAEHDKDQADLMKQKAETNFAQMQQQLKAVWDDSEKKSQKADKEVNDAIEQAWKESGLSKDEYLYNPASFVFEPKTKDNKKDDKPPIAVPAKK